MSVQSEGTPLVGTDALDTDSRKVDPGFGAGGVPWILLLFYLSFLCFFTWYVLEYQLPDFLNQGPGQVAEEPVEGAAGGSD